MDADEDQDQTVPKSTKDKREQCPGRGCPKNFNVNSSGLRKHLKSCQYPRNQSTSKYEKVGDRFKCSQCLSTFSYRNNLHKHFNLYHIVKKPKKVRESKIFPCVACSKTFPRSSARHVARKSFLSYSGNQQSYSTVRMRPIELIWESLKPRSNRKTWKKC